MKLTRAGKASCMVPHAWAFSAACTAEGELTFRGIIECLLVTRPLFVTHRLVSWAVGQLSGDDGFASSSPAGGGQGNRCLDDLVRIPLG